MRLWPNAAVARLNPRVGTVTLAARVMDATASNERALSPALAVAACSELFCCFPSVLHAASTKCSGRAENCCQRLHSGVSKAIRPLLDCPAATARHRRDR